ncbi:hypothetical protein KC335_g18460, partial [Hortaea werneckii]
MFRKPTQQQPVQQRPAEMQMVDRSDTTSPFWRTASANSQRDKQQSPTPERKVIGASYSHADVLNFNNLSLSGDSRPRTPPKLSRQTSTPASSRGATSSPQSRPTYKSVLSQTEDVWGSHGAGEDPEDQLAYDDDEDEFGLPSIASMRRKGKRMSEKKAGRNQGSTQPESVQRNGSQLATSTLSSWALDNGDVAEERNIPSYPMPKKSEGKILRPQYKDILRDPANSLHLISHPPVPPGAGAKELEAHSARITR